MNHLKYKSYVPFKETDLEVFFQIHRHSVFREMYITQGLVQHFLTLLCPTSFWRKRFKFPFGPPPEGMIIMNKIRCNVSLHIISCELSPSYISSQMYSTIYKWCVCLRVRHSVSEQGEFLIVNLYR